MEKINLNAITAATRLLVSIYSADLDATTSIVAAYDACSKGDDESAHAGAAVIISALSETRGFLMDLINEITSDNDA